VPPIAVIGSLAHDLIGGQSRVGGGAFHAARGLRLLDVRATIVTKTSQPELLQPLVALGFPVESRPAATMSTFTISYDGDDRTMLVSEVGEPWTPEDARTWVRGALDGAPWLHVAPLMRTDFPAETLAELARGRRLLLDAQGLVRVPATGDLQLDADYDPEVLRHVTALKLAEEEARVILPDFSEESLASLGVPEVLLTFGSRGSLVWCDGRAERVPANPVDADATGAGDAFSAAYIASRASGQAPVASARRAAVLVESLLAGA
jgi:sugar/nucleoside kinase (ribokinase family)